MKARTLQPEAVEALTQPIRERVGLTIRAAREQTGLTQAEFAEKMGRRQAYISDLETGKTEPTISTLIFIAYVLGKPADYFIPNEYMNLAEFKAIKTDELSVGETELIQKLRQVEGQFSQYGLIRFIIDTILEYGAKMQAEFEWWETNTAYRDDDK
ncbi:MAG: helix-turn-helix domain-containing protein [Anaerolineae bacterium]|nr:helix-turn-helix domain-containing protein [Anaerolineae bacterium]